MNIQKRVLTFVVRSNWTLFFLAGLLGLILAPLDFAKGIIFGGLIVNINFHLLHRTLKNSLTPANLSTPGGILAKYYLRFIISGFILFSLLFWRIVDPIGLVIGVSTVVASIMLAALREIKHQIFKEAI